MEAKPIVVPIVCGPIASTGAQDIQRSVRTAHVMCIPTSVWKEVSISYRWLELCLIIRSVL